MSNAYIIQANQLTVVVNGKTYSVAKNGKNYTKIIEALRTKDWDLVQELVDIKASIKQYSSGKLQIKSGECFWDGKIFHNSLSKRLVDMFYDGIPVDPLVKFMENLERNPSKRAVDELYTFLEKNSLPITDGGTFIAYKRVKQATFDRPDFNIKAGDLVDAYTGKIRNNVGDQPTMKRNEVDDDCSRTCSEGLHFASMAYLDESGYASGGTLILIEVDPADVVSIPRDYNNQKGRCCSYRVLSIADDKRKAVDDSVVVRVSDIEEPHATPSLSEDMIRTAFQKVTEMLPNYRRRRVDKATKDGKTNLLGNKYTWVDPEFNDRILSDINSLLGNIHHSLTTEMSGKSLRLSLK